MTAQPQQKGFDMEEKSQEQCDMEHYWPIGEAVDALIDLAGGDTAAMERLLRAVCRFHVNDKANRDIAELKQRWDSRP